MSCLKCPQIASGIFKNILQPTFPEMSLNLLLSPICRSFFVQVELGFYVCAPLSFWFGLSGKKPA